MNAAPMGALSSGNVQVRKTPPGGFAQQVDLAKLTVRAQREPAPEQTIFLDVKERMALQPQNSLAGMYTFVHIRFEPPGLIRVHVEDGVSRPDSFSIMQVLSHGDRLVGGH